MLPENHQVVACPLKGRAKTCYLGLTRWWEVVGCPLKGRAKTCYLGLTRWWDAPLRGGLRHVTETHQVLGGGGMPS